MSDFDDFDDDFAADESFLAAIDGIEAAATAASTSSTTAPTTARAAPAVQPSITSRIGANSPFKTPSAIRPGGNSGQSTSNRRVNDTNAESGPSRRAAALGVRPPRPRLPPVPPPVPSSDDFDDISFSEEALAQIDAVGARGPQRAVIPSSNLGRTARPFRRQESFHQTHLNFYRENPYTKGKRWDRTAYAASGRRLDAEKAKKKGKRKRAADDESDDDAPLLPDGAPLIDTSKPYDPPLHSYDPEAIKTYIYPTNHPKRKYQYEIIRNCFTDNTLVALPTGLGKTFVAGVVMLNFFRWFPSGKIVFMAPTKPLVLQQIEACQLTCGIPSTAAAVMTGEITSAAKRDRLWEEKRVFYCTPQTLQNDLERGAVDPRDIVLAVVDEAHRASGSYAYNTVIARITAVSPYFRVLALTATPGNKVEKVQGVVDGLHISRIEIREAESPEVTQYTNEKKVELHTIPIDGVIRDTMKRWADLMRPQIKKMVDKGIFERDIDPFRLRAFTVQARTMEMASKPQFKWIWGPMGQIRHMAQAMGHLLEYSLGYFYETAQEISGATNAKGKAGNSRGGANSLRNNREFQSLMTDVEFALNDIKTGRGGKTRADLHPKMKKTLDLLLAHFAQAEEDTDVHGTKNDTRAMVFTSYRRSVLEIVDALNEHPGLLRATKFVGQADGKKEGDKGFKQKDQKQAIADFKEGKFNIIVSTSVGEEGLDIGEVDFIILYDMPQQSIKQIQRIGRTGRKRDGIVHVLMTEGREEGNWHKAQQTHRDIQHEILLNSNIELFEDVERLLPPGELPKCVEQEMPVDPWDPTAKDKVLVGAKKTKAKRAPVMEVPEGAEGFKSVSAWLKEGKKGKGKKALRDYNDSVSSDDDLESSGTSRKSGRSRKARKSDKPKTAAEIAAEKAEAEERERREREEQDKEAIDFFNTQGLVRAPPPGLFDSPPPRSPTPSQSPGIKWTPSPKPVISLPAETSLKSPSPAPKRESGVNGTISTNSTARLQPPIDLSFDVDEDIFKEEPPLTKPSGMDKSTSDKSMPPPPLPTKSSPYSPKVGTPIAGMSGVAASGMGTPLSRRGITANTPQTDSTEPTPFPVRTRRRIGIVGSSPASPASLQRLRRRTDAPNGAAPAAGAVASAGDDSSPIIQRRRRRLRGAYADHELLDLDAAVSGSDSGDESSASETSQDRLFAGEFAATQAPSGYDQRAIYAAGLSTQACARAGLRFDRDGATERAAFLAKARKAVLLSDDERDRERDSEDEYEVGSFVCDDEDIAFASE